MSELKEKIIDNSDAILSHPLVQKTMAATPLASGGAAFFEVTQGWLAIASLVVGLVAGVLVIQYNWTRTKLIDKELELKSLEVERLKNEIETNTHQIH